MTQSNVFSYVVMMLKKKIKMGCMQKCESKAKTIKLSVGYPDNSLFFFVVWDRSGLVYLDGLFKVEHFPVDLVANHSCIHFGIHHLYG